MRSPLRPLAFAAAVVSLSMLTGCGGCFEVPVHDARYDDQEGAKRASVRDDARARLAKYTTARLTTDLSALTAAERQMIPLLIDAAREMDGLFWQQAYGDPAPLLGKLKDPDVRRFVEINYGPWDRLDGDASVLRGHGAKMKGANFYPHRTTKAEFEAALAAAPPDHAEALRSHYTLVRLDDKGGLTAVPYHQAFAPAIGRAAASLTKAAALAADPGLARYLTLRAEALRTDEYRESDLAWLEMRDNTLDIVIGPIETYEDQLMGYKAAYAAYVLVKDRAWSERLARYAPLLPELQRQLPVPEEYRRETPGSSADLAAYDVIYYAGDANAGGKAIAVNLPNDEQVQLMKGTRRLQLKNAMKAKFDSILTPIAGRLVAADQRGRISFDAFFANVMFHEVAHGLGIKKTLDGRGTVREALEEHASSLEEAKADVLGLRMAASLAVRGLLEGSRDVEDYYVTYLAGILRSVRFGASSAHGRANAAQLNFLMRQGAIVRDEAAGAPGTWRIDAVKMPPALDALAATILKLQGDGHREGAKAFLAEMGGLPEPLRNDLAGLSAAGIPVDVIWEQGPAVLGI